MFGVKQRCERGRRIRGAHAPSRAHCGASPQCSWIGKFAMARAPSPAREAPVRLSLRQAVRSLTSIMRDRFRPGDFVRVAGTPIGYTIEQNADAQRIDHLSILVQAGKIGTIEIAL